MYSKNLALVISLVIFASFETYAGTAIQTDWSGGDGVWGPVIDWSDEFYVDTDIECYNDPSNVSLRNINIEHIVDGDFNEARSVCSADIDGDGDMDVLAAAGEADDITWWENVDGSGTSWIEHTVDGEFDGAYSVYSADINGDGDMDVLGAARFANDITWWENVDGTGTSWTEHVVDGFFDWAWSVYSADINGDGYMDVLGAAWLADDITWWENVDGSGNSWIEHTVDGDFNAAISVYSADVNGDGDMDVLGAANFANDITWWENVDGTGTSWTEHAVEGAFNEAISVFSADINGDGYMDILGAAENASDNIVWWENVDGSGTSWIAHCVSWQFNSAKAVYSADVDGDGYMDVLGAGISHGVVWWENDDGSGTSWTWHTLLEPGSPYSVYSSDIDGDGCLDILGAFEASDDVFWWDITTFLPEGALESSVLDVQESPDWQTIDWTCTEPSGTSVALQVRASNNSSSMGAWSDTLTSPCTLTGILTDEDSLFQYRAILTTTDSLYSPELHDVTVDWVPFTSTQEEAAGEVTKFALFGAQPNPTFGHATLVFSMPVDSKVELIVYDLAGRIVHSVSGEYEMGVHEVILDDLTSGIYVVRMTSDEFTEAQHFVVIN